MQPPQKHKYVQSLKATGCGDIVQRERKEPSNTARYSSQPPFRKWMLEGERWGDTPKHPPPPAKSPLAEHRQLPLHSPFFEPCSQGPIENMPGIKRCPALPWLQEQSRAKQGALPGAASQLPQLQPQRRESHFVPFSLLSPLPMC